MEKKNKGNVISQMKKRNATNMDVNKILKVILHPKNIELM